MKTLLALITLFLLSTPAEAQNTAHDTGQGFKEHVADIITRHGLPLDQFDRTRASPETPLARDQVAYTSLYGSTARADFVITAPNGSEVWIEASRLLVPGSIDEKLPHMFLEALVAIPAPHVIILVDGPGWRQAAIQWLRAQPADPRWSQFSNPPNKRIDVMNVEEFTRWLNATY